MSFRVGQKVVCVDDSATPGRKWMHGDKPTVGKIYEVMGFEIDYRDGKLCLIVDAFPHWGFKAWRFRPIVERKTDIEIFTSMLKPSKVEA